MNMTRIMMWILLVFLFRPGTSSGQLTQVISNGIIDYEKRVNNYTQIKELTDNVTDIDQYLKENPQFQSFGFKLYFSGNSSLYFAGDPVKTNNIGSKLTSKNIVFSDFKRGRAINQQSIFDQLFLVTDSIRHINWKITSEKREILGYECRRANAIILDSVYVVAFYAPQILPRGGPELFNGLPGMILQISLPHEHISWVAQKITIVNNEQQLKQPQGGKQMNLKDFKLKLINDLKPLGNPGTVILRYLLM